MWNGFDVSFQDEEDDAVRYTAEKLEMQLRRMREQNLDRRLLIIALTWMSSGSFFLLCRRALTRWAVGTPCCVSRVGIWIKSHGLPGRLLLSLRRPLLVGVGRWY